MGDYSSLYVSGSEILSWKYIDCPPILAMIYESEEREVDVKEQTDDGTESRERVELRFRTTVAKATDRLRAKGLTIERVEELALEVLNAEPEENGADEDSEFVIDLWVEEGLPEIGELLVLWPALEAAKSTDVVVFDAGDALEYDNVKDVRARDFIAEARSWLRRRLQAINSLLGFVMSPTPETLGFVSDRLALLNEKQLLDRVIVPILQCEGYYNVESVEFHGPSEFGSDTKPMRRTQMGVWYYEGVQAKAIRVGQSEATHAAAQIEAALTVLFNDTTDNLPKRLSMMLLFLSQGATEQAKKYLSNKNPTQLRIFETREIAELILKHDLIRNLI